MATMANQDIRDWGRENGFDVANGGRIPRALSEAYNSAHTESDEFVQVGDWKPDPEVWGENAQDETAPKVDPIQEKPLSATDKVRQRFANKPAATNARTVKPKSRVPVDRLIERAWDALSRFVAPVNVPMSRVLAMQSPVAGLILEPEVKGTIVDRVLQPIARTEKRGEVLFALIGPPLIVGALSARPQAAPVLVPMLRESLAVWIDVAGPKVKVAQERAQKFQEQYGQDIDDMIGMIFADWEGNATHAE